MTVAALILANPDSLTNGSPSPALTRLIEAAWSGGAHPILVSGLTAEHNFAPLAQTTEAPSVKAAGTEAQHIVGGTSALLTLPIAHAGIDPETVTALIAAHGRDASVTLRAAFNGSAGPVQLTPLHLLGDGASQAATLIECGDEAAILPSDGRTRLSYEAPPADTNAVDPWEQRGTLHP
ncbi:MAG: hypothetical protein ACO38C_00075 [Candidatus Limnocylindrus sp.]|jgi:hypothetical protein